MESIQGRDSSAFDAALFGLEGEIRGNHPVVLLMSQKEVLTCEDSSHSLRDDMAHDHDSGHSPQTVNLSHHHLDTMLTPLVRPRRLRPSSSIDDDDNAEPEMCLDPEPKPSDLRIALRNRYIGGLLTREALGLDGPKCSHGQRLSASNNPAHPRAADRGDDRKSHQVG